jgi:hypothetical protein
LDVEGGWGGLMELEVSMEEIKMSREVSPNERQMDGARQFLWMEDRWAKKGL